MASAAVTGGSQAELYVDIDGEMVQREPTAVVVGSGTSGPKLHCPQSLADTDAAEGVLTGTWAGQSEPQPLVLASVR